MLSNVEGLSKHHCKHRNIFVNNAYRDAEIRHVQEQILVEMSYIHVRYKQETKAGAHFKHLIDYTSFLVYQV